MRSQILDCIVIGGGQAGLSVAYFLKRKKVNFLVLDDCENPGGSWQYTWDSLKLFSPAQFSSLSGWQMPKTMGDYPTKDEFLNYLRTYEKRYDFPIERGVLVDEVVKVGNVFELKTQFGVYKANTVVSATGTAKEPFIPHYANQHKFKGIQMHSSVYKNADNLNGKHVLVIGGGNSGAQILAEISKVATTKWVTLKSPVFLPKEIDGRYLFNQATAFYLNQPGTEKRPASLGDIVQVESVREGLERNVFNDVRPFEKFTETGVIWQDGIEEVVDAVVWCTGFKPNLRHLKSLGIVENFRVETVGTRVVHEPNLWLVGYGNWTGFASATIYGVGKTAKRTVEQIVEVLNR